MTDDFHGPQAGCTYNACGVPEDAANCPFTRDDSPEPSATRGQHECKHEWRQHFAVEANISTGDPVALPDGYYCIHCLNIVSR